jgi:hypothetical protein
MVVSIVRATFIMAATAAFFGLAVLGWGGLPPSSPTQR